MIASRRYILKAGAGLVAAGSTWQMARAAFDRYLLDEGRGAFAWFEARDGKKRTWTAVLIIRAGGEGPDGKNLYKPVVLVWTTTFNPKKGKVQRVAFGAADDGRCTVTVPTDLRTASVNGSIRVWDAVKDESYTLDIGLSWTENGSERSLNFNEIYSPEPDETYSAEFRIRGDQRPAKASGELLRGNKNLTPKSSEEAFIGFFDADARATFTWP